MIHDFIIAHPCAFTLILFAALIGGAWLVERRSEQRELSPKESGTTE